MREFDCSLVNMHGRTGEDLKRRRQHLHRGFQAMQMGALPEMSCTPCWRSLRTRRLKRCVAGVRCGHMSCSPRIRLDGASRELRSFNFQPVRLHTNAEEVKASVWESMNSWWLLMVNRRELILL